MTQDQYSTKGRKFNRLTLEKRAQLEMLLRLKQPKAEIARLLGVSRSTLYNELKRGTVDQLDSQPQRTSRGKRRPPASDSLW